LHGLDPSLKIHAGIAGTDNFRNAPSGVEALVLKVKIARTSIPVFHSDT
jgi:hypothetical protein